MRKKGFYLILSFFIFGVILIIILIGNTDNFDNKNLLDEDSEYMASYMDGEYQNEIPGKDDGYVVDKIVCDNGATATWDNEEWGINIRNATQKIKCSLYFIKAEYSFEYTGAEQAFAVPKTGTYKIETWGAQGEGWPDYIGSTIKGGVGGYSSGNIYLTKEDIIYINVGRQNENGSNGQRGGGATHIATKSGSLSTLKDFKSNIIIVSGGGGGSEWVGGQGGAGGGFKGNDGKSGSAINSYGGSQTAGGKSSVLQSASGSTAIYDGSFGQGGYTVGGDGGGQGGNGYYGGGASDYGNGGGGGSGYIGNSLLTNKVMYCYNCEESTEENTKTISTTCAEETPTENCAKKGNGYARITYIGD